MTARVAALAAGVALLAAGCGSTPNYAHLIRAHVTHVQLAHLIKTLRARYPRARLTPHVRVARLQDGNAYYVRTSVTGSYVPRWRNVLVPSLWLATVHNGHLAYRYLGEGAGGE